MFCHKTRHSITKMGVIYYTTKLEWCLSESDHNDVYLLRDMYNSWGVDFAIYLNCYATPELTPWNKWKATKY